jgi:PIN domain nuclease of toxin-antitoxin system
LKRSAEERTTVVVSAISAREIGLLAAKNRMRFDPDPVTWFKRATAPSLSDVRSVSADDYLTACSLPDLVHQDPSDRILIAQARRHGLTLVTRDAKILAYAEAGHLDAMPC